MQITVMIFKRSVRVGWVRNLEAPFAGFRQSILAERRPFSSNRVKATKETSSLKPLYFGLIGLDVMTQALISPLK